MPQDPSKPKAKASPVDRAIRANVNPYLYQRPGITTGLLDTLSAITQGNRKTNVRVDSMPIPHGNYWMTNDGKIILGEYDPRQDKIELLSLLDSDWMRDALKNPNDPYSTSRATLLHEFGHRLDGWGGEPGADLFRDVYELITRSKQDRPTLERRLSYGNPRHAAMAKRVFQLLDERAPK